MKLTPPRTLLHDRNRPEATSIIMVLSSLWIVIGLGIGVVSLIAWALERQSIQTLGPANAVMTPWTAVGVVAAGVAIAASTLEEISRSRSHLAVVALGAVSATLIGLIVLGEHLFDAGNTFDLLLWGDQLEQAVDALHPGRPSVQTAIALVLLGASQIIHFRHPFGPSAAIALTAAATLVGVLGVLGHIFDVNAWVNSSGDSTGLSLMTSVSVATLGLATTSTFSVEQFRAFARSSSASRVMRTLLPSIVVIGVGAATGLAVGLERGGVLLSANSSLVAAAIVSVTAIAWHVMSELRRREAELEQLVEHLQQANDAKRNFLTRASHELRTPLNAIAGFGQLLELEQLDDRAREYVAEISTSSSHLLALVDDVLDLGRIEAGRVELEVSAVAVNEVVDGVVAMATPIALAESVTLLDETGPDDAIVLADRRRLQQVLLNLVTNAVKYNHPGGTVTIRCDRVSPWRQRIEVVDTGVGIDDAELSAVFQPFTRVASTSTWADGTGLGLAVARELTYAMGGSLDCTSQPGVGSTFFIELPTPEALTRFGREDARSDGDEPDSDLLTSH